MRENRSNGSKKRCRIKEIKQYIPSIRMKKMVHLLFCVNADDADDKKIK